MISCDSCQEWFHGDCVGISETEGRKMERRGEEYICPPCTAKRQSQLQSECRAQQIPERSSSESTILNAPEEGEGHEEQQAVKVKTDFGL